MTVLDEFERFGQLVNNVPLPESADARETRAEALMLIGVTALVAAAGHAPDWKRDCDLVSYLILKSQKWLERKT